MELLAGLLSIWAGISLAIITYCVVEIRYLENSRDSWKQYSDDVYERSIRYADGAYERSTKYAETVRDKISEEVSLALDTLIACNALAEREKSIMLAVAYHLAPIEKDNRLLSERILSQLAFEDAIKL